MHIQQPNKCRNGRYRFEDEIKINNTDSLSKLDEDEYPSENLEKYIIQAIVERNDQYAMPSKLVVKYKLGPTNVLFTTTVTILPTVINAKKHDKEAMADYVHFQTHEDVQAQTKAARKGNPKQYEADVKANAASIIDYLKRDLCEKYLKFKRQSHYNDRDLAIMKYIENLSIVREFDLKSIPREAIGAEKLRGLNYLEDPNQEEKDFYAIVDYSRELQSKTPERAVCFTYVRENENILGLRKGKTPEEVEKFAIEDARAHQNKLDIELLNTEIFDRYTNHKVMQRPKEMQ